MNWATFGPAGQAKIFFYGNQRCSLDGRALCQQLRGANNVNVCLSYMCGTMRYDAGTVPTRHYASKHLQIPTDGAA